MNLPVPISGQDPGPDYALNINAAFAQIDSHNHSPTQGVQINPNGLNINADLPMGNNNLTLVRSIRFTAQSSAIGLATDLGCLYEAGVDLYYNDGNGNQIRITQSGAVSGATGTITGLPSGTASASYSAGKFTFQSATNTAANMDVQSIILRNSGASSNGLTLSAPTLSTNFTLTLPQVPSQNATFMQMDTSGNITAVSTADGIGSTMTSTGANAVAATRTRATGSTVAAGGVASSAALSTFTTNLTGTNVTGLAVTITTSGRPVWVGLVGTIGGGSVASVSTNICSIGVTSNSGANTIFISKFAQARMPISAFNGIDFPSAGTITYQATLASDGVNNVTITNTILVAYEL